jgi:predicted secreted protein
MALAGRGGSVKYSSSTGGSPALVADLREWSLAVEADMFEISTFGSSGWKEFMPNLNGAQGSIAGYWTVQTSTTEKAIQSHLLNQSLTPGKISLLVDAANGNGYQGDVWVTGLQLGASVDGIVPFTANITMSGAVSYSTTL